MSPKTLVKARLKSPQKRKVLRFNYLKSDEIQSNRDEYIIQPKLFPLIIIIFSYS